MYDQINEWQLVSFGAASRHEEDEEIKRGTYDVYTDRCKRFESDIYNSSNTWGWGPFPFSWSSLTYKHASTLPWNLINSFSLPPSLHFFFNQVVTFLLISSGLSKIQKIWRYSIFIFIFIFHFLYINISFLMILFLCRFSIGCIEGLLIKVHSILFFSPAYWSLRVTIYKLCMCFLINYILIGCMAHDN